MSYNGFGDLVQDSCGLYIEKIVMFCVIFRSKMRAVLTSTFFLQQFFLQPFPPFSSYFISRRYLPCMIITTLAIKVAIFLSCAQFLFLPLRTRSVRFLHLLSVSRGSPGRASAGSAFKFISRPGANAIHGRWAQAERGEDRGEEKGRPGRPWNARACR